MGDEFQLGSGNWWDNTRNRSFDSGTTPSSISTTLNTLARFGSPAAAPAVNQSDSMTATAGGHDHPTADEDLQMMGLGISSPNPDWNQALLGEKVETSFRYSLLQDGFQPKRLYSAPSSEDSSVNRSAFPLDQTAPLSSQATSNDSTITSGQYTAAGFRMDFHGMVLSGNQQQLLNQNQSSTSYHYSPSGGGGYGTDYNPSVDKYPQSLRTSQPPPVSASGGRSSSSHLQFTNNAPLWNASGAVADARWGGFFPVGLQTPQIPTPPSFHHDKPKDTPELEDISARSQKNQSETSNKRARGNETPSPIPAFKVRKEKMGDRITALQQIVSPFGKTDTASVLSEAIAYIKFLHEQVLSNPYMKNGAPTQHHQVQINSEKCKEAVEDLRSRGLCLVPVSSTFPITHETTVDFWTPTYGGTFR